MHLVVTMERQTNLVEHLFYSLQWTGINVIYNDCPLGSRFPHISSNGELLTVTRRVSLMEQELQTLPEHLSSPLCFSGVRVVQSLVVCVELLTVTRQVSLVEQELLTLPEHLSSPLYFSVAQVFVVCVLIRMFLFFPFNIFFESLYCLPVLRITASGYPPFVSSNLYFTDIDGYDPLFPTYVITNCSGY